MLFVCFNVLVCQRLTLIDLGVWMALQSLVASYICQCIRKSRRSENMVDQAWDKLDITKLRNVYGRWKLLVLDMTIKNEGGDRYIESN